MMRQNGIKAFKEKANRNELSAKYLCRSYTGNMLLFMDRVKSDVSEMLADLLGVDLTKNEEEKNEK